MISLSLLPFKPEPPLGPAQPHVAVQANAERREPAGEPASANTLHPATTHTYARKAEGISNWKSIMSYLEGTRRAC